MRAYSLTLQQCIVLYKIVQNTIDAAIWQFDCQPGILYYGKRGCLTGTLTQW